MRTLVLHIGLPKSGSTALQNAFAINRDVLSRQGVHYAPVGVRPDTPPTRIFGGNGGALDLFLNTDRRPPGYDPSLFKISDYLSPDHPLSLISSEWLSAARERPLIAFRDSLEGSADIKIVAFIRDLAAHARSAWVQAIKSDAYSGDLKDYCLEKYTYNYQYRRLRLYRKVFGADSVTAIHYDSLDESVLEAFMRTIGSPTERLAEPPRANRGLTEGEIGLMRRTNALHRSPTIARAASSGLIALRPNRTSWTHVQDSVIDLLTTRHVEELRWANDRFFAKQNVWRVVRPRDFKG